jgi:hypothetical protein
MIVSLVSDEGYCTPKFHFDSIDLLKKRFIETFMMFFMHIILVSCLFVLHLVILELTLYSPYQFVSNAYDIEESANDLLKYAPEFGGAEGNSE